MLLPTYSEESVIKPRDSAILNDHQPSITTLSGDKSHSDHQPLQARLSLKFAAIDDTTRLVERDHFGPLLVQKPLYPEGRKVCHAVIIHPPGGIVGGDQLEITADAEASAKVQIKTVTLPGKKSESASKRALLSNGCRKKLSSITILTWPLIIK